MEEDIYPILEDKNKEFFSRTLEEHVCIRCALMLTLVKDIKLYRTKDYSAFLKQNSIKFSSPDYIFNPRANLLQTTEELANINNKAPNPDICFVCLGIIQYSDSPSFLEKVAKYVKNAGREYDDFKLVVTLPKITLLRTYWVLHKVSQVLGYFPPGTKLYESVCI